MEYAEKPIFEKYALFQTGGKQYQAIPGKTVAIEKIEGDYENVMGISTKLLLKMLDMLVA